MNLLPSNNENLYGYKELFLEFKELYDKNLLPNKIIFCGSNGIGKSTFVYHLINYIFSLNESNRYNFEDNIISKNNYSYNLILKDSHPNFFSIFKDEKKETGQISKIREMINFTNKSSFNNKHKIILIDNIENLNVYSINALLKLIEDPNNNIFFFIIHNSKKKIPETLSSRCIKFKFFLNNNHIIKIINKLTNDNFYLNLNSDFKNFYNAPGDILSLYNFFKQNDIDNDISIDELLKLIISKGLFKKNLYIKDNLPYLIELFFYKKINFYSSKQKIYLLYKYFLSKISDCNKYNLDLESILIEFNGRLLND